MVDPIADMLTRIRNAIAVGKTTVSMPYSKSKAAVAKVLNDSGYLAGTTVSKGDKPALELKLAAANAVSPITEIHRVSKPGLRVYVSADEIPTILGGRGIVIVSTSKGIMSGKDARKEGIGGELMCKVW